MDGTTFDDLSRRMATSRTRRGALAAALGTGAGLLLGRGADAAPVEAEGNKCKGKSCNKNKNCGKGLVCNNNGKCEYKNGNKGKKGDTCCNNNDCKSGLKCKNDTCKNK